MGEKHSSDKADKAAMEKRRRRMLERADKLEAQAKELMAEAEKARARYTALTKAEEQGDDRDDSSDGTDEAVSARLEAPSVINTAEDEVIGDVEEEEDAASKKKHGKEKKEKKSIRAKPESTEGALADAKDKKDKKKKKKEKKKRDHSEDDVAAEAEIGTQDKKAAKKEKKRKREAEAEADEDEQEADDAPTRKNKKEKKEKKSKKEKEAAPEKEEQDEAVVPEKAGASGNQGAEQWNVGELGGGASRQSKFFRLLGGKKGMAGSGSSETAAAASRGKANLSQMADDLQRQFDTGMRMKFDAGGQRRGLGA